MTWINQNNKLTREFKFKDFIEAMGFITKVGLLAEKMNHHPKLISNYNFVILELSTHSAGNVVTQKDFDLAHAIDHLL